jgi:hypothetical protein
MCKSVELYDIGVDVFDYQNYVGVTYKDKKILNLTGQQAWDLAISLMTMARLVDKSLPKEVKL